MEVPKVADSVVLWAVSTVASWVCQKDVHMVVVMDVMKVLTRVGVLVAMLVGPMALWTASAKDATRAES